MGYKEDFQESILNPEKFWVKQAEMLEWYKFPETILSKDANGFFRWFKGGKLNTSYLVLDYHVKNGRADQIALIYDSPVSETIISFLKKLKSLREYFV